MPSPNRPISRSRLRALALELGHDPKKVSRIEIATDRVFVTYEHVVVSDPRPEHETEEP